MFEGVASGINLACMARNPIYFSFYSCGTGYTVPHVQTNVLNLYWPCSSQMTRSDPFVTCISHPPSLATAMTGLGTTGSRHTYLSRLQLLPWSWQETLPLAESPGTARRKWYSCSRNRRFGRLQLKPQAMNQPPSQPPAWNCTSSGTPVRPAQMLLDCVHSFHS